MVFLNCNTVYFVVLKTAYNRAGGAATRQATR